MNKTILKLNIILFFILFFSCGGNDIPADNGNDDDNDLIVPDKVSYFIANGTKKANEIELKWGNPTNISSVEILYRLEGESESSSKK
ncbi:MAG: hypothetical protein PHQ67_04515 [Fermentimonas sp.]|nr:hypothetical protein [Fermentimonas sp.]MDD4009059.1 hypothetical protein [Fermentimonas sp.]